MPLRIRTASLVLLTLLAALATAQPLHRLAGSPSEIRNVTMNANNVTFIMYNYGQFSRPNTLDNVADFVWHKLGHMYEFGPLLLGEVIDTSGQVIHILDDGLWLSSQGGYAPDGSLKWGWLPRAGYGKTGSALIPTVRDTANWPSSWSAWPSLGGATLSASSNQAYYVMDDFTNKKYQYYPFPDDSSKRGLGVSAQVWTTQYQGTLQDAVVITWRLKNESPKQLTKCYFGFYGDPHIGGSSDYSDDLANFIEPSGPAGDLLHFQARNTIYTYDANGTGMFELPTDYMGMKFLKTPGDHDLTTFWALPYGGSNFPKNDQLFTQLLSADSIAHDQQLLQTPGDNVLVFGTGPFALAPGDSTEITLVVFFSESYNDMLDDASAVYYASHWPSIVNTPGQSGGDPACAIQITAPQAGKVAGDVQITWNYSGTEPSTKIYLEYSRDGGNQWHFLASDLDPSGLFTWHTASVRDGTRYLIRAVAYASDFSKYAYNISAPYLTIDNTVNAQPEVELFAPAEGTVVQAPAIDIGWNARDADNSSLAVTLFSAVSPDGPFSEIHSGTYASGPADYIWDLSSVPNASSYYLKITVSDGVAETSFVSKRFAIAQEKGFYADSLFHHTAGRATIDLRLQVTDPSQLKGHTYQLTFAVPSPDSAKRMTVTDMTSSTVPLSNFALQAGFSTPAFDGVKLTVMERPIDIDTLNSGFTRKELNSTVNFRWTGTMPLPLTKSWHDWIFVFNALDTLPNGQYLFPGDTAYNNYSKKVVICPFRVIDVDSSAPVQFIVTSALSDSLWRPGRPIILLWWSAGSVKALYQVNLDFSSGPRPGAGDTLWLRTFNPLTAEDVFQFTTDNSYILGVRESPIPASYVLYNNYPNPFNPTTSISFDLPRPEEVTLQVFDLLGRVVADLVRGRVEAGHHIRTFDASRLASGVYFYRLQAGSFVETKKLLLVR